MRYLIYTETFPAGAAGTTRQTGIGRYCYDLACGLSALGHEVTVLTGAEADGYEREGRFRVRAVGARSGSRFGLARRAAAVSRQILRGSADWTIVGDPDAHRVFALVRPIAPTPYCPILYGTELKSYRGIADRSGWMWRTVAAWMLRAYIARAAERICISRFTQGLLSDVNGMNYRSFILYPVVSEIFLSRPTDPRSSFAASGGALLPERAEPLKLITVGRISERKNQLGVLEVLADLRRTAQLDFHYYILGNVDGAVHRTYLEEIERFVATNGLAGNVSIIDRTTDETKVDLIDACDVFIMLSRTVGDSVEGFGISVIEASCRGKPVIVSTDGGMPETIIPGVTGFAVDPRNRRAVGDLILRLARDRSLREAMGSAGKQYVLANFTQEIMGRRLHQHLTALPATTAGSRARRPASSTQT